MSNGVKPEPKKTWQRGRHKAVAAENAVTIRASIIEHLNALFPDHPLKTQIQLICAATGWKYSTLWFRMVHYTVSHHDYSVVRMYYLLCTRGVFRPGEVVK